MRVWRIPFSTNVERVALALGHKGLSVEWVDVDPADRSPVEAISGQRLVPVLDDDGSIVTDSTAILEHLEARHPDPPLYPREEARRAEARAVVDWFNRVWKVPPNLLDDAGYDDPRSADAVAELERSRDLFEALLAGRDHLFGDELTVVDVVAFPFLKYAVMLDPDDDEEFHRILNRHLRLDGRYPRLAAWIQRVDARPRA
jgi:glutathione S-transferase